jgi:hypothetical protein
MSNFDAAGAPDAPSPSSLRLTELLIDEYVRRLSRPGRDGTWYRSFIADWLYFERPMMDRFKGRTLSLQLEGPPLELEGRQYPLGGFIQDRFDWARITPRDAFELREQLRVAVDQILSDWMRGKDLTFVPARPEPHFADRSQADAEAEQEIRDFARFQPDLGDIPL